MALTNNSLSVSIIMPTYNRADVLPRAINSVLSQTYPDFEFIIIDDCSTDNTRQVLSKFNDDRIKCVFLGENKGASFARNKGLEIAGGDFIAFQDSDDEWMEDKLEKQMAVFSGLDSNVGVLYSDVWEFDRNSLKTYRHSPSFMPEDAIIFERALSGGLMNIGLQSTVLRKECFKRTGMFEEKVKRLIDVELLIRVSKYFLFYHIKEPLVNCYIREDNISLNRQALLDAQKLILEKYVKEIKGLPKMLCKYTYEIGTLSCQLGNIPEGRQYILKAFKACPYNPKFLIAYLSSFLGQRIYCYIVKIKKWLDKI